MSKKVKRSTLTDTSKLPKFRSVPHRATRGGAFHWPLCSICGLVYLNNEATRVAIKKGCEVEI